MADRAGKSRLATDRSAGAEIGQIGSHQANWSTPCLPSCFVPPEARSAAEAVRAGKKGFGTGVRTSVMRTDVSRTRRRHALRLLLALRGALVRRAAADPSLRPDMPVADAVAGPSLRDALSSAPGHFPNLLSGNHGLISRFPWVIFDNAPTLSRELATISRVPRRAVCRPALS